MTNEMKELLNLLMSSTDYNVFKCVNTKGNLTRLSIIVPKKCIMYYKNRRDNISKVDTSTKTAVKHFKQFKTYVYNDMGFCSDLCTIDLCIENISSRFSVQKIEFLKNERYYLFIDSTPIMCISRFYEDKYASYIEVYESLKHLGSMKNNMANIIIDVIDVRHYGTENNLQKYTDVTFAVYKLRTSDIIYLNQVTYSLPFILLTEDYNYNNATLERLYDKIYEEYIE